MSEWQPIETALKGGGAERTDDPEWVEPPRILAMVDGDLTIVYWDWYYAPDGDGYEPGQTAWVDDAEGSPCAKSPTHWMPLPELPKVDR